MSTGTSTGGQDDAGGAGSAAPLRYGSTFRRLYGHAAYSLVAVLSRMCAGALKGPPLRDLVETCFEEIACRPVSSSIGGGNGGSRGGAKGGRAESRGAGGKGRGKPNPELNAFAVMHASDLLQCFSEVCTEGSAAKEEREPRG